MNARLPLSFAAGAFQVSGFVQRPADARPTGRRTQLKADATIPVRSQIDTLRGRVELTSAATGTGATTQKADFYQGTFKVRQSVPKGNRAAALTTDITLAGETPRSQCASARGENVHVAFVLAAHTSAFADRLRDRFDPSLE